MHIAFYLLFTYKFKFSLFVYFNMKFCISSSCSSFTIIIKCIDLELADITLSHYQLVIYNIIHIVIQYIFKSVVHL